MSVDCGRRFVSAQENTRNVLVFSCAAKKAVALQFCATRILA
jgi:hypothetical protein